MENTLKKLEGYRERYKECKRAFKKSLYVFVGLLMAFIILAVLDYVLDGKIIPAQLAFGISSLILLVQCSTLLILILLVVLQIWSDYIFIQFLKTACNSNINLSKYVKIKFSRDLKSLTVESLKLTGQDNMYEVEAEFKELKEVQIMTFYSYDELFLKSEMI